MALKKTIQFENGAVAEYHKISIIHVYAASLQDQGLKPEDRGNYDPEACVMFLDVDSYRSEDFRNKDLDKKIMSNSYRVNTTLTEAQSVGIWTEAYRLLAELPLFLGSEYV